MAINAFSDWQQRVARPFEHGGWGLNQSKVTNEEGKQASILSTYRGPGREKVLDALQRHGLVDAGDVDAVNVAREAEQEAKAAAAESEQAARTRRAFGIASGGGGGAQAADAGALSIMVVPDGARDLSPNMLRLHAARGYLPMGQTAYDALVAAQDGARAARSAAESLADAATTVARFVR